MRRYCEFVNYHTKRLEAIENRFPELNFRDSKFVPLQVSARHTKYRDEAPT